VERPYDQNECSKVERDLKHTLAIDHLTEKDTEEMMVNDFNPQ